MIVDPRSVVIIASREEASTLTNCVTSVVRACKGRVVVVDVLVNGNPALAHALAQAHFERLDSCTLRIWSIQQGDKAHAWNEYVHRIWPAHGDAIFVDGYVELEPNAFTALDHALAAAPDTWAATGVPTSGRSAAKLRAQMLREGGFHGNLNIIRAHVLHKIRATAIRLPLGLYRTDSLIGALLMFGLDPAANQWDRQRITVVPDAAWKVRGLGEITLNSILLHWKRMLRQAQGELENRAVREHLAVKRLAPNLLPATAQALVRGWLAAQPAQARQLLRKRPLCAYAAWRLREPRDWSATEISPLSVVNLPHSKALAQ